MQPSTPDVSFREDLFFFGFFFVVTLAFLFETLDGGDDVDEDDEDGDVDEEDEDAYPPYGSNRHQPLPSPDHSGRRRGNRRSRSPPRQTVKHSVSNIFLFFTLCIILTLIFSVFY